MIVGNAHTHPGRFYVMWDSQTEVQRCSVGELSDASPEARIWLNGFLHGNEPEVWQHFPELAVEDARDANADEVAVWLEALREFRASGFYAYPEVVPELDE